MCNLYRVRTNQRAIADLLVGATRDGIGNLAPLPGIYPDHPAPIMRTEAWMTAPWSVAKELQRPLADGMLRVVARRRSDMPEGADERDAGGGDVAPKRRQGSLL